MKIKIQKMGTHLLFLSLPRERGVDDSLSKHEFPLPTISRERKWASPPNLSSLTHFLFLSASLCVCVCVCIGRRNTARAKVSSLLPRIHLTLSARIYLTYSLSASLKTRSLGRPSLYASLGLKCPCVENVLLSRSIEQQQTDARLNCRIWHHFRSIRSQVWHVMN